MNYEKAKNAGFVARMNGRMRVPAHDKKFIGGVKENAKENRDWSKWLSAWLSGWDECNLEYASLNTQK